MGGGNFAILNPCPKKWSDLEGDGRARFCETCKTDVHDVARYSPEEWSQLKREANGHVCGSLSGASPTPPRSRRAILFGALLTAVTPLFAATGRVRFRVLDVNDDPLPKSTIELLERDNNTVQSAETGESGEAILAGLPMGVSRFTVTSPGFPKRQLTLTLHRQREVKVAVHLFVPLPDFVGEVVEVKPRKRDGWLIY